MPYPASVDANVIAPWTLVSPLLGATYAYGSSHIIATDRIYLHSVWLPAGATVVHMRVPHGGTSAGNLDMGIYDFNGNLLDRTGIIAAGSAFSTQDALLSNGNLYLPAGRYYLAFWADNQTDTYYQLPNIGSDIPGFGNLLTSVNASVSGLQANFAAMGATSQNNCCYIAMLATLQGSTSGAYTP